MKGFFPNYIYIREVMSFRYFLLEAVNWTLFVPSKKLEEMDNDPKQTTFEQFCILYAKKCSHNKVTK